MKRKLDDRNVPSAAKKNDSQHNQMTFGSLGLDSRILQAIVQEGFSSPTLVQAKAIPLALEGKDLLARAKTGSGKTAAYVLPILQSILRRKANNDTLKYTSGLILVPTRELAQQVCKVVVGFSTFCAKDIQIINITQKVGDTVLRSLLADSPDIVVATPARASVALNTSALSLDNLTHLVIDEADLVLSYGYDEDLKSLVKSIPKGVQTSLMSATLSADVEEVKGLFCRDPSVLELDEAQSDGADLAQYVVKCGEDEKFLLVYVIFKLKLIKGKCIIFVGDIDRCYRLKLFLEQFGIKSCVLNSELPVNSRIHVVEEFNKNVYEIIIASDEHEAMGEQINSRSLKNKAKIQAEYSSIEETNIQFNAGKLDEANSSDLKSSLSEVIAEDSHIDPPPKKKRGLKKDKEYGVSRGIDFKNVTCVLNFDLPTSPTSYTHRIGRTARAGRNGMALSFVIPAELYHKNQSTTFPTTKHDEEILKQITQQQTQNGQKIQPYHFNMSQVNAFRYRMTDALRAITRIGIRAARTRELRQQLLQSAALKRHFEENPQELHHLRHDSDLRAVRVQPHLKHVPEYLMPKSGIATTGTGTGDNGFVPMRKPVENRIRRARLLKGARRKGGNNTSTGARGKNNPLQSFRAKGRK